MRPTTIVGAIFAIIGAATLLGVLVLQSMQSTGMMATNPELFGAVGLAWMFGVWGTLVACMVFLIVWTATKMQNDSTQGAHGVVENGQVGTAANTREEISYSRLAPSHAGGTDPMRATELRSA